MFHILEFKHGEIKFKASQASKAPERFVKKNIQFTLVNLSNNLEGCGGWGGGGCTSPYLAAEIWLSCRKRSDENRKEKRSELCTLYQL